MFLNHHHVDELKHYRMAHSRTYFLCFNVEEEHILPLTLRSPQMTKNASHNLVDELQRFAFTSDLSTVRQKELIQII